MDLFCFRHTRCSISGYILAQESAECRKKLEECFVPIFSALVDALLSRVQVGVYVCELFGEYKKTSLTKVLRCSFQCYLLLQFILLVCLSSIFFYSFSVIHHKPFSSLNCLSGLDCKCSGMSFQ